MMSERAAGRRRSEARPPRPPDPVLTQFGSAPSARCERSAGATFDYSNFNNRTRSSLKTGFDDKCHECYISYMNLCITYIMQIINFLVFNNDFNTKNH